MGTTCVAALQQSIGWEPSFHLRFERSRHEKRKICLGRGCCALLLSGALPVERRGQRIGRYCSCGEFSEPGERFVAGRVAANSDGGAKILGRQRASEAGFARAGCTGTRSGIDLVVEDGQQRVRRALAGKGISRRSLRRAAHRIFQRNGPPVFERDTRRTDFHGITKYSRRVKGPEDRWKVARRTWLLVTVRKSTASIGFQPAEEEYRDDGTRER